MAFQITLNNLMIQLVADVEIRLQLECDNYAQNKQTEYRNQSEMR